MQIRRARRSCTRHPRLSVVNRSCTCEKAYSDLGCLPARKCTLTLVVLFLLYRAPAGLSPSAVSHATLCPAALPHVCNARLLDHASALQRYCDTFGTLRKRGRRNCLFETHNSSVAFVLMYASQTRTASADICESRAWSVSPTRFPISVPTRCSRATSYSIRVSRAAIRSSQSICRKKGDAKKGDGAIIRLNPADPEQNRVRVHFYENCTLTLSLATSPLLKAGPE